MGCMNPAKIVRNIYMIPVFFRTAFFLFCDSMIKTGAKTAKGRRVLASRESKAEEGAKNAVFMKATTTSEFSSLALKDLYALKKPHAVMFQKRNDIHPFTSHEPLSFLAQKNQAALFCIASHSKKRPNCITFCRTFEHQVVDMIEFNILDVIPMDIFEVSVLLTETMKPGSGMRPLMVFQGHQFEDGEFAKIKDFFIDFFRGDPTQEIDLKGLEYTICITADESNNLHFRTYMNTLKKQAATPKIPQVELVECGPVLKLALGRRQFCPDDIFKMATQVAKELKPKKVKNVGVDDMGDRVARIHMKPQDLGLLQTRKMKGLKRKLASKELDGKKAKTTEE